MKLGTFKDIKSQDDGEEDTILICLEQPSPDYAPHLQTPRRKGLDPPKRKIYTPRDYKWEINSDLKHMKEY